MIDRWMDENLSESQDRPKSHVVSVDIKWHQPTGLFTSSLHIPHEFISCKNSLPLCWTQLWTVKHVNGLGISPIASVVSVSVVWLHKHKEQKCSHLKFSNEKFLLKTFDQPTKRWHCQKWQQDQDNIWFVTLSVHWTQCLLGLVTHTKVIVLLVCVPKPMLWRKFWMDLCFNKLAILILKCIHWSTSIFDWILFSVSDTLKVHAPTQELKPVSALTPVQDCFSFSIFCSFCWHCRQRHNDYKIGQSTKFGVPLTDIFTSFTAPANSLQKLICPVSSHPQKCSMARLTLTSVTAKMNWNTHRAQRCVFQVPSKAMGCIPAELCESTASWHVQWFSTTSGQTDSATDPFSAICYVTRLIWFVHRNSLGLQCNPVLSCNTDKSMCCQAHQAKLTHHQCHHLRSDKRLCLQGCVLANVVFLDWCRSKCALLHKFNCALKNTKSTVQHCNFAHSP